MRATARRLGHHQPYPEVGQTTYRSSSARPCWRTARRSWNKVPEDGKKTKIDTLYTLMGVVVRRSEAQ